MPEHTDKLLLDLIQLSEWIGRHAVRHPDQAGQDATWCMVVGQAYGRIQSANKHPECFGQSLLALEKLMSAISDFADVVNKSFDTLGTAVDGLVTDVAGLKADIQKLQDSAGKVTPEDQALLDSIETRAQGIADKAKAIDDLTEAPPVPPT